MRNGTDKEKAPPTKNLHPQSRFFLDWDRNEDGDGFEG